MIRKITATFFLIVVTLTIGLLFWHQEVKYLLPTPIPKNYTEVKLGSVINHRIDKNDKKPSYLHFYNPNCPCSKFNFKNFEKIVSQQKEKVNTFFITNSEADLPARVKETIKLHSIKIIEDPKGVIARKCGVYSTPQLVLLTKDDKLYFRGNYNKARYCTNQQTNYAKQALDSILISEHEIPQFESFATKAYGCELK